MDAVLHDVASERGRQDTKWGDASAVNLSLLDALPVLVEEVGEVATEILKIRWGHADPSALYVELIQVAAVAVAMAESLIQVDGG